MSIFRGRPEQGRVDRRLPDGPVRRLTATSTRSSQLDDLTRLSEEYRVVLLGNAGTGKSWFQLYALKQLLSCDQRDYDIVIRQVGNNVSLIDLDEAVVYEWKTDRLRIISEAMTRTLYFFEPGDEGTTAPLGVFLPSLSTLKPYIERIKEYEKRLCTTLYFWPWSSGELRALIQDSDPPIMSEETFCDRFHKFGGVLRHVLGEDRQAERKLTERLNKIDINTLISISLNIDRDDRDNNVSGFLVCYDNRSSEGERRFEERNLEYTSAHVVENVRYKIRLLSVKEVLQNVLHRLSGEILQKKKGRNGMDKDKKEESKEGGKRFGVVRRRSNHFQ